MSTPVTPCPDCGAPLTAAPTCASCGLPVVGPAAARLWQVDQRLAALEGEQHALRAERTRLLEQLRRGLTTEAAPAPAWSGPAPTWAATATTVTTTTAPRAEASPRSVQNTLLSLGALLLAGAVLVFAAVTYRALGVAGRAVVLLALTAAVAAAPRLLLRRGLTASAEAVAALAVVLAVVDAWSLRRAGVGDAVAGESYWAAATGVLALLAGAYATAVPVVVARLATVLLAQLPAVLVLARLDASPAATSVTLAVLAAVDVAVALQDRLPRDVRQCAGVLAGAVALGGLAAALAAVADDDRAAAAGFLALGLLAAGTATALTDRTARALLAGSVPPLAAAAAWAVSRPVLTDVQQPLVLVAAALLSLQVTALLRRADREGPVGGALLVAAVALLAEAEPVLLAVAGPFTWLAHPWTLVADRARDAVAVDQPWTGTVVTLVVLAAAAGSALAAGLLLDRLRESLAPTGALLVLAALVLPLGLATDYHVALLLLLLVAGALGAAGLALLGRQPAAGTALVGSGVAVVLVTAVWSVADRDATLAVLPCVAVLLAAAAVRLPGALTGLALLAAGAELAAVGADQGWAPEQVGGLLLVAPAVAVAASYLLRGAHRVGAEAAAALLAGTAVVLAAGDPGWLSWTLAASGVLAIAVAVRPDRRVAGLAGGLLLSASSWVRLADAGVHAPEPYVAPVAVAALVFGHLRRRAQPSLSSFEAYGAGLSVALVPSLLKALTDDTPARGLLLLAVCSGVVLAGVADRQRAPLAIGGAVLVVDALQLLAPYAAALPRWLLLGAAGTLLLVVGATYEQRLRDVARLRERYSHLA